LQAALDLGTRTLRDIMTPIGKVYMLNINQNLDETLKRQIYEQGYSLIPVYEDSPDNIVGLLMTRDLILANIDDNLTPIE
jgi:CBS domain containing-hemolysin-like protein